MVLDGKELKVLRTEDEIQSRIKEIATELNERLGDKDDLYVICVLKGSVMFTVDLVKHLKMPIRMEFIRLASYGHDFTSSGKVKAIDISLPDVNGKNVLIVEDIVDTGRTAKFLIDFIKHHFDVKNLVFCSLMDKKIKREVDIDPDIYGFEVDDKFLVGYGLDYQGYLRNLTYVGYVDV